MSTDPLESLKDLVLAVPEQFVSIQLDPEILSSNQTISDSPLDSNNLYLIQNFIQNYSITGQKSCLKQIKSPDVDYLYLRSLQNKEWAIHKFSVSEGLEFAQKDDLKKAIKKYTSALELDPSCIEAYVARGAALANMKSYSKAISDFYEALKLNPDHANAKAYLEKTKLVHDRIEAEKESAKRGEFLMSTQFEIVKPSIRAYPSSFSQSGTVDEDSSYHFEKKQKRKKHKSEKKKRKHDDDEKYEWVEKK